MGLGAYLQFMARSRGRALFSSPFETSTHIGRRLRTLLPHTPLASSSHHVALVQTSKSSFRTSSTSEGCPRYSFRRRTGFHRDSILESIEGQGLHGVGDEGHEGREGGVGVVHVWKGLQWLARVHRTRKGRMDGDVLGERDEIRSRRSRNK